MSGVVSDMKVSNSARSLSKLALQAFKTVTAAVLSNSDKSKCSTVIIS
jgi:hypothetical protein